ncbi:MAG: MBL fold metallo-hydrolase [Candidatus Thermochlorobacter sp.]
MKVTHIAHACMLIESNGVRLLTDPWLEGPTFFGSWWQFPPPKLTVADIAPVDCIYISHSHRDHQHEPTLRLFDKNTPILIPYLSDQEQHRELQAMGFKNIIELDHKEKFQFKNAIDITLFRNDWDSAILVHDGESTLLNANDCYISHLASYIRSLYPKLDIAFFPFLDARDFPASYDLSEASFHGSQEEQDDGTIEHFIRDAIRFQPKAVVPFASHKVFARPNQHFMNKRRTPLDLRKRFEAAMQQHGLDIEFFDMNSTDTWESGKGFTRHNFFDWENVEAELQKFYASQAPLVQDLISQQRPVPNFSEKFAAFATALTSTSPIIRKFFLDYKLAFCFEDQAEKYWLIDFPAGRFSGPLLDEPKDYDVKLTTSSYLFNESMIERREYWEDTLLSNLVFAKVKPNIPYTKIKFLKVFFNVRCDEAKFLRITARKAFEKIRVQLTA